MGIADQPRIHPFLDVTVAAAHFHGTGRHRNVVAAGAEFQQRREDSQHAFRALRAGIGAIHRIGAEQEDRERLFGGYRHLQKLAAEQGVFDDGLAKGLSRSRADHRLVDAAPHHCGGPNAMGQPRQVDLFHHLLEAAIRLADQIGDRALQQDFAARHRTGAQFVLEANDAVGVAAAIFQPARQGKQCESLGACWRAFRPRQQQRDIRVGVRAEPFVAEQPPYAVLAARDGFDRADVGAAGTFGHELRALPHRRDVAGQHLRQQIILQLGAGEFANEMDRGVGHADRAHQPELGLHEQILQRIFGDCGQRAIHVECAGAMAHGVELEIAERDRFHFAIGRMVIDPVLVAAEAIPCIQDRRVLVGGPGEFIQPAAGQRAEAVEMRLEPLKIVRFEIELEKIAQAAIDRIEILPRTVPGDEIGAAIRVRRRGLVERCLRLRRMHAGSPLLDRSPGLWRAAATKCAEGRTSRSISTSGTLFQHYRIVR